jgi:hypothetical protein
MSQVNTTVAAASTVAAPSAPSVTSVTPVTPVTAASSAQAAPETKAFDFIAEGLGYLNRIREVKTSGKAKSYLACTINAMMGTTDAVQYVAIDCRVVGKLAMQSVRQLKADVDARRKVIVAFRVGDIKPDFYTYKDRTTGEQRDGQGLKARLLQITLAKVDGQKVDIAVVPRGEAPEVHAELDEDHDAGAGSACEDASAPALTH